MTRATLTAATTKSASIPIPRRFAQIAIRARLVGIARFVGIAPARSGLLGGATSAGVGLPRSNDSGPRSVSSSSIGREAGVAPGPVGGFAAPTPRGFAAAVIGSFAVGPLGAFAAGSLGGFVVTARPVFGSSAILLLVPEN